MHIRGGGLARHAAHGFCVLFIALACLRAGPSFAQAISYPSDDFELTAAFGVESNAVFRGQRSTKLNPSVYAALELERGDLYLGGFTSPSSIQGEVRPLMLLYLGYAPEIAGFQTRIGVRRYLFPASREFNFDLDDDGIIDHSGKKGFVEGFVGASRVIHAVKVDTRVYFAPDVFGETGGSLYVHTSLKAPIGQGFDLRGDVGVSRFARNEFNDNYVDYGIGLYKTAFGLDFFLRYSDTAGLGGSDDRIVVFGIEKAWTLLQGGGKRGHLRRKIRNRDWRIEKNLIGVPGVYHSSH